MEMLKLNETPVRTSRNYKINNIKLENVELPTNIKAFTSTEIIGIKEIDTNVSNIDLVYGTGKILEENINNYANSKIKIENTSGDIQINYNFDAENTQLINNLEIIAEKNLNIIIKYESKTKKECFHNGVIRLLAKENANVNITIVNLLNNSSNNFDSIENVLQENANVNYTIIDIGAKNSVSNYYSNLMGNGAKNDLKTIYLGTENQVKDINYIAHTRGEKTEIDIDVQGALKDFSKKNFKGTIDFKKGCKNAKGNENEYCMMLSDTAKSIALPMLLCTEDNVEGNHSTSSGKVEPEILFYIMSRGISYKEAIKLITRARFGNIIERIQNEELKQEIFAQIDRRLD